ncbi:MAG: HAD family hydrolase [Bacteroidota bacterium]
MIPLDQSWTLFLDRDGVINRRLPGAYVQQWEEFEFYAGNLEALAQLSKWFATIIVVTNQQGIGKGMMSAADLEQVHERMRASIEAAGGRIDAIYYCPDLKTKADHCRKPRPALALQAQADFPQIHFERSIMVGDSLSDLQFGHRLGMKTVWITTKLEELEQIEMAIKTGEITVDFKAASLAAWTQNL